MARRFFSSIGVLAFLIVVGSLATIPAAGQAPASTSGQPAPMKTAWGDPDLQGVWGYATITPLERPSQLAGKEFFTEEEAARFEQETLARRDNDRRDRDPAREQLVNGTLATADVARAYNQFWWDYGTKVVGTRRTSLIVDPKDGKIPAMTPEARERQRDRDEARERAALGPEDRSLGERCINWGVAGPPMIPGAYNNNVQLFQTKDHVVIHNEMIHGARIVPLDDRTRPDIRQLVGLSRGRWEGNTLVVETTNFTDQLAFRGASDKMRLTERFTRLDANTLQYEFTVDDPSSFSRSWSASIPMTASRDRIFEYACHEGNYGMVNLLSGARALERGAVSKPGTR